MKHSRSRSKSKTLSNTNEDLETILITAINDEYLAKAKYEEAFKLFGRRTPFFNIRKAEARHAQALTPLVDKYCTQEPDKNPSVDVPNIYQDALLIAIKGECETCRMYIANLKNEVIDPYDDVKKVFQNLLEATIQHYKKFCEVYEDNFGSIPDEYECNEIE